MLRRMRHIAQPLLSRASTVRDFTLSSLPPTANHATAPSIDVARMHAKLQRLCDDNDFAGIVEEVAAYYRPLLQPLEGTAFDPVMTARVEEEAMALLAKYLQQDAATLLYENLQAMTAASPLVQPTPCTMSFLMSMLSSTDVEAAMDLALGRGVDPTALMNASYLEALISTKQLAKAAAFWRQLSDANGPRNPSGYHQAIDLFQTLQSVKDLKRIADDIVLHRIPLCELDYQNLMLGLAAGYQNKNDQANGAKYAEAVLMLLDNMQRVDSLSPSLGPIDVITMDARNYLGACDAATTTSTSLLVDAAPTNDVALHNGENPNSSNENGVAAIVDVSLAQGVAATVPDIWGSPLYRAVLFNEPEKVKSLLPSSDIDAVTGGGDYPLYNAALNGRLEIVQLLVEAGATVAPANKDGGTPLMAAAMKGQLATVARLLQEASLHEGSTALYWAVNSQQPDDDTQMVAILSMLLAAGANPLLATNTNPTVFTQAITRGWRDVAELLLPYFDIDAGDLCYDETKTLQHFSYLRLAINTRRAHIVSWLLELGADANQEIDGHLPLLDAVMHSDASTLAVLLPYMKDLEVINPYGHTAVFVATIRAKVEMLQLLAAHGANVACVDQAQEPKTAIVMASLLGHAAVVHCLLELGAPIDVPNVVRFHFRKN
ncbi:hypothetical protein SPRG_04895 [Saprolegnia parasitica CBS 223.65]|uniref:Uncharacterized protein n=1 Tax=Saprolegnia parasitica (strain CBS 223.65) TaxID=695850 RepID=A0A067CGB1_SAPPC|nr:hypothetical protein SPRG_04895 [Saprolegnia parasitica CBS 223.65]KDO29779.1 hypothetical protein SPRG_04895 [Saprolegnia parasitica CBS 223.65]|eukprot:XP_012199425.1 hypothetical protein SPRG_04895 [Saprolegnia parasitica CBS 223.65]